MVWVACASETQPARLREAARLIACAIRIAEVFCEPEKFDGRLWTRLKELCPR